MNKFLGQIKEICYCWGLCWCWFAIGLNWSLFDLAENRTIRQNDHSRLLGQPQWPPPPPLPPIPPPPSLYPPPPLAPSILRRPNKRECFRLLKTNHIYRHGNNRKNNEVNNNARNNIPKYPPYPGPFKDDYLPVNSLDPVYKDRRRRRRSGPPIDYGPCHQFYTIVHSHHHHFYPPLPGANGTTSTTTISTTPAPNRLRVDLMKVFLEDVFRITKNLGR